MSRDSQSFGDLTAPLEALTFEGGPGEDVTAFLGAVKRIAIVQGRQRDEEWMIDYVESCLRGDAMAWFDGLSEDSDITSSWRSLRSLFLRRFATRSSVPAASYAPPDNVPLPAAAPSVLASGSGPRYNAQSSEPPLPSLVTPTAGFLSDKTLLLGDSCVGKSSLMRRYLAHGWDPLSSPTVGTHYEIFEVTLDGKMFQDHLWDVSGAGEKCLISRYIQGVRSIWIVYDITSRESFDNIFSWRQLIPRDSMEHVRLIGNKSDLWDKRVVSEEEGRDVARRLGIRNFFEASAKSNHGFQALREGWVSLLQCNTSRPDTTVVIR